MLTFNGMATNTPIFQQDEKLNIGLTRKKLPNWNGLPSLQTSTLLNMFGEFCQEGCIMSNHFGTVEDLKSAILPSRDLKKQSNIARVNGKYNF